MHGVNARRSAPERFGGRLLTTFGLCGTVACAHGMPPPTAGSAGLPRVGWVIMSGDRDSPDHDFVCQSNPPSDCLLDHSQPDRQVFAHLHFYFHPARTDTQYGGSIRLGFFSNKTQELNPDLTVK